MKKNTSWVLLLQISLILIAAIASTYAINYFANSIQANMVTANIDLSYIGDSEVSDSLLPIKDTKAEQSATKVKFSVIEKNKTNNIYSGYRVVLRNVTVPVELRIPEVKWQLVKGLTVIASGNFENITNTDRYLLNEELQVLPKYGSTADELEFRVWLSDNDTNQIALAGKTISFKVDVELYVINDKIEPLFLGIQDKVVEKSSTQFNTLTGVSAVLSDGTNLDVTANITSLDISTLGDKIIVYSAKDANGKTVTKTRTIRVLDDKVVPVIDMSEVPSSIALGTEYDLQSKVKVTYGSSSGSMICGYGDDMSITKPSAIGSYKFKCIATGNNGLSSTASKNFSIIGN